MKTADLAWSRNIPDVFGHAEEEVPWTLWHTIDVWGWEETLGTGNGRKNGDILNTIYLSQQVSQKDYTPSSTLDLDKQCRQFNGPLWFLNLSATIFLNNSFIHLTKHLPSSWAVSSSICVSPNRLILPSRKWNSLSLRTTLRECVCVCVCSSSDPQRETRIASMGLSGLVLQGLDSLADCSSDFVKHNWFAKGRERAHLGSGLELRTRKWAETEVYSKIEDWGQPEFRAPVGATKLIRAKREPSDSQESSTYRWFCVSVKNKESAEGI